MSDDSSSDDDAPIASRINTNNSKQKMDDSSSDEDSSSDDDIPINQLNIGKPKTLKSKSEESDSSDDDAPLIPKKFSNKRSPKTTTNNRASRKMSISSTNSSSNSPLISKKRKRHKRFDDSDESEDDDVDTDSSSEDNEPIIKPAEQINIRHPPKKKQRNNRNNNDYYSSSSATSTPRKRKKANSNAPGYIGRECNKASKYEKKKAIIPLLPQKGALKWWEHENDATVSYSASDDSKSKVKWHTLDHNGIVFAPEYVPHGIPIKYDGKPIQLTPDQEEIATMFGVMIETDWAQKEKFRKNFMKEFTKILRDKNQSTQHPEIKDLDKCDFRDIFDWYQRKKEEEKEKKKDKEYKKKLKLEKEEYDAKFGYAIVDGVREKVGNYKVEPPGLFRGRGEHPKMGMLKRRIMPKNIILNIGHNTPIPPCPIAGEEWGGIIHDQTVTYIAKWVENINGQHKFVYLGASSRFKGQNDRNKYEKARVLKTKIDKIRKDYETKLVSKTPMIKQLATAVWMIDKLSIRVGNEKDTDEEADTVGVCSLRKQHIKVLEPIPIKENDDDEQEDEDGDVVGYEYKITLDFLGKDSMRYHQTVNVTKQVYKNLRAFLSGKKDDMDIFEKIDPNKVNDYLRDQMDGLTAKVFRTHNASTTLESELSKGHHPSIGKISVNSTLDEKIFFYNQCNMQVAILCNHQRSVSKTHAEQLQKIDQQIQDMKDTIEELEEEYDILIGKRKKKSKKFKKKTNADGSPKKTRQKSEDQLVKQIKKKKEMLRKKELQKAMKEDNKEVALGTSKINYMDPRITVAWCKRLQVPIEKIFNKSLLDKFPWAMQSMTNYGF